jgi:hypothetical protein
MSRRSRDDRRPDTVVVWVKLLPICSVFHLPVLKNSLLRPSKDSEPPSSCFIVHWRTWNSITSHNNWWWNLKSRETRWNKQAVGPKWKGLKDTFTKFELMSPSVPLGFIDDEWRLPCVFKLKTATNRCHTHNRKSSMESKVTFENAIERVLARAQECMDIDVIVVLLNRKKIPWTTLWNDFDCFHCKDKRRMD